MHETAREEVSDNWRQRGLSRAVWTDPPGQVGANFVHETDKLVILIDGRLEMCFNGHCLRPEQGEEIFIPAGARHTVPNIGTSDNHWYYGYHHA